MIYNEVQTQLGIGFAAGIQTKTNRRYGEIRNTPAMLHSCIVCLQHAVCEIVFGLPSTGNMPTKPLHVSLCLCCVKTVVKCFIEEKDPWGYGTDYEEATGKERKGNGIAAIQSTSLKWSRHTNRVEISIYNVFWQTSEPGAYSCPYLAILLQYTGKLKVYSLFIQHQPP